MVLQLMFLSVVNPIALTCNAKLLPPIFTCELYIAPKISQIQCKTATYRSFTLWLIPRPLRKLPAWKQISEFHLNKVIIVHVRINVFVTRLGPRRSGPDLTIHEAEAEALCCIHKSDKELSSNLVRVDTAFGVEDYFNRKALEVIVPDQGLDIPLLVNQVV